MAPGDEESRNRRAELVMENRHKLLAMYKELAERVGEKALANVDLIEVKTAKDLQSLITAGAIATDKALLLSGGATQRSEYVVRFVGADSLRALSGGDVLEGEVTEVQEEQAP